MRVILDDGIRPFIEARMTEIDPVVYTKLEFEQAFSLPHIIAADVDSFGKIIAFCVIIKRKDYNQMTYTWSDGSKFGKRAYLLGIKYMIENFAPIGFSSGAMKFNKIKRMVK